MTVLRLVTPTLVPGFQPPLEATMVDRRIPIDLGDIDLRQLRATVTTEDGEWVLLVGDEDARVTFATGLNGQAAAILGAERLASAATAIAEELRHLAGVKSVR